MRFAGQYYDQETGLHYNYHRYYDPKTGRYITPDPIGLDGGTNLYAYVQNNPVNLIDPLGLVSAGQLGIGNTGSYGGDSTCESMYDERGLFTLADIIYIDHSDIEIQYGVIPIGPVGGLRGLLGKGFPTKLNRGGLPQPYNPKTGQYLSYGANPGLNMSPVVRFAAGFGQGWAAAKGASGGTTPVGTAGNIGYTVGSFIGNLF